MLMIFPRIAFPVQGVKYTKKLGIPFSDLPGTVLDYNQIVSAQLRGALMYQMRNTERYYGAANSIKFYGSTNFPAYIYICRNIDDNDGPPFGLGVPTWLSSSFSSRNVSIQQLILDGTTTTFGCFYTVSNFLLSIIRLFVRNLMLNVACGGHS